MGKVTLQPGQNIAAYNHSLGRTGFSYYFDDATLEIEIPEVDQATMDAGLVAYTANQAADDANYDQHLIDTETLRVKDTFDGDELRILRAFAKLLLREINDLRGQHGLAPRTFAQFRTALRNELDTTP